MSIIDPNLLADLFASRNVELVKWEDNSLQVLAVLHPVDEVSTHDVALRKYTTHTVSDILNAVSRDVTWYGNG